MQGHSDLSIKMHGFEYGVQYQSDRQCGKQASDLCHGNIPTHLLRQTVSAPFL